MAIFQSRKASKLLLTTIFELVQNSSFIITFFRIIKSARGNTHRFYNDNYFFSLYLMSP